MTDMTEDRIDRECRQVVTAREGDGRADDHSYNNDRGNGDCGPHQQRTTIGQALRNVFRCRSVKHFRLPIADSQALGLNLVSQTREAKIVDQKSKI